MSLSQMWFHVTKSRTFFTASHVISFRLNGYGILTIRIRPVTTDKPLPDLRRSGQIPHQRPERRQHKCVDHKLDDQVTHKQGNPVDPGAGKCQAEENKGVDRKS